MANNILIISSRADFGGGPQHICSLIEGLNNQARFYIACPRDYPFWDIFKEKIGAKHLVEIPHRKFCFKSFLKLKKFIKVNNIRIIHSHGKGAGLYGRLLSLVTKVPSIHTFHGIHLNQYNPIFKKLYLFYERKFSKISKINISVSKSEFKTISDLGINSGSNIKLIENGVLVPDWTISEENFRKVPLPICSITRFDFAKNTELVVDICVALKKLERLSEFTFILIGDGPNANLIKEKARDQEVLESIIFIGSCLDPMKFLMESFCYLSTSRWEGLPLAVLEAMSIGVPIIGSFVTGNADLIRENISGIAFESGNAQDAAQKILNLKDDFKLWKQLSLGAKHILQTEYNISKQNDDLMKLYRSYLG